MLQLCHLEACVTRSMTTSADHCNQQDLVAAAANYVRGCSSVPVLLSVFSIAFVMVIPHTICIHLNEVIDNSNSAGRTVLGQHRRRVAWKGEGVTWL